MRAGDAVTALKMDPRSRYKREWANAQPRATCACGATLGVESDRRGVTQCHDCYLKPIREAREERYTRIARMWAEGATHQEIADALGYVRGGIGVQVARARAAGWDLSARPPGRRKAKA